MSDNTFSKRRRLDIEPIAINKKAFLDLLEKELPDDFDVVVYEFHKIASENRLHVGTTLKISLLLKDFSKSLIKHETETHKEKIITDLTTFDKWEPVAEWLDSE